MDLQPRPRARDPGCNRGRSRRILSGRAPKTRPRVSSVLRIGMGLPYVSGTRQTYWTLRARLRHRSARRVYAENPSRVPGFPLVAEPAPAEWIRGRPSESGRRAGFWSRDLAPVGEMRGRRGRRNRRSAGLRVAGQRSGGSFGSSGAPDRKKWQVLSLESGVARCAVRTACLRTSNRSSGPILGPVFPVDLGWACGTVQAVHAGGMR